MSRSKDSSDHRFCSARRGYAEARRNSLDRGGPVVGLHNRIKHLMTAVERGEQGIGDLAAGGGSVVISHHVSLGGL